MRPIIYEDKDGYLRRVLVRDDDPDSMAKYGVPAGPPNLKEIDWEGLIREVNNALVTEGANTWQDVNRSPSSGINTATSIFKRHLIQLYKIAYQEDKSAEAKEV